MGLRFTSTWTARETEEGANVTHLLEIYDSDFGLASTALEAGRDPVEEITGDPSDTLSPGLAETRRVFRVLAEGSNLEALQEISGSDLRRWSVIFKKDGTADYTGYILTEDIQTGLLTDERTFQILVKDGSFGLEKVDFTDGSGDPYAGAQALSTILANGLAKTGFALSIKEDSQWKSADEAGRPLSQQVAGERWSDRNDEEGLVVAKTLPAVDSVLKAEGLRMCQFGGAWHGVWPMGRLGASTVTLRTYNSAGVYQSEDTAHTAAATPSLDSGGFDWERGSDKDDGTFAHQEVTAEYAFKPGLKAGSFVNGSFEDWHLDSSNQPDDTRPVGWLRGAGTFGQDYRRWRTRPGADGFWAGGVREVTVAFGSSAETMKAAVAQHYSQILGTFAAGLATSLKFSLAGASYNTATSREETFDFKIDASEAFYAVEYITGGVTYHYDRNSTSWRSDMTETTRWQRPDGLIGSGENFRFNTERTLEKIDLPATPGSALGTMRLLLSGPVRALNAATDLSPDIEVWALWDDVALDFEDDAQGAGIAYAVADAANSDGETETIQMMIGEGPGAAPGAILLSDGTTLAKDFRAKAGGTTMPITQLLATEEMRYKRTGRRRISFRLTNQTLSAVEAFDYDSERWFPVYVRTVYTSPGLLPQTDVVAEQLVDGNTTGLTTTTGRPQSPGILAAGSPSSAILSVLSENVAALSAQMAVTVLAEDLASGAQTQARINSVERVFLRDDDKFFVVSKATGTYFELTASGDYAVGTDVILFDSFSFGETVPKGSYVFLDTAELLTFIAILEEQIVLGSRRDQAAAAAVLGEDILTPTAKTALTVEALTTRLRDGRPLFLVSSVDNTTYPIVVGADADPPDTSVTIESQVLTGKIGDVIVGDGASQEAELLVQPHRIYLSVTEERTGEAVGTLTAEASGSLVQTLSVTATKTALSDGVFLHMQSEDTEDSIVVEVDGAHAQGVTTIDIIDQDFGSKVFPIGTPVRITNYSVGAEIKVNAGEILLRAYETGAINTHKNGFDARRIAKITATANSATHTIEAAEEKIDDNTKVLVAVPQGSLGQTDPFYLYTETQVNGDVAKGATSITFDDTVNVSAQPAFVLLRDPGTLLRFQTNEASITVNATSITNLVAQYEANAAGDKRAVCTMNATYSASAQGSILITGLNETLELEEVLLIWNKANEDWYEVVVETKLVGTGGSQTLDIKNVGGGATVTITADSGDPILRGTMSQLRQDVQGFTFHSRFLKSGAFNGTITESSGDITAVGSNAGWAFGANGDVAAVQDADNYLWFDGTRLKQVYGGNALVIDENGISLQAESSESLGIELGFHTDADSPTSGNRVGRIYALTSGNDDLYISTHNGAGLQLSSAEDCRISVQNTAEMTNGTGQLEIDDNANITLQNTAGSNVDIHLHAQRDVLLEAIVGNVQVRDSAQAVLELYRNDATVGDTDGLGRLDFMGADPSADQIGARISATARGSWGTGDLPTSLEFSVVPDGSGTLDEILRITEDGLLVTGAESEENITFLGAKNGTADPTGSDFPTSNTLGLFWRTDTGEGWLCWNRGGSFRKIQFTT